MESHEDLKSMYVNLVDTLNCGICKETLKDARDLSCGHTFCLGCLTMLVTTKGWRDTITCCLCKKNTRIPSGGLNSLKQNYKLNCIIDEQKGIMQKIATSMVSLSSSTRKEGRVTVYVNGMEGKVFAVRVQLSDTADSLKIMVAKKTGIPPEVHWLQFEGKLVRGNTTLREFGLDAELTLHLLVRGRGGEMRRCGNRTNTSTLGLLD